MISTASQQMQLFAEFLPVLTSGQVLQTTLGERLDCSQLYDWQTSLYVHCNQTHLHTKKSPHILI